MCYTRAIEQAMTIQQQAAKLKAQTTVTTNTESADVDDICM
jgi:hypothetical protein